MVTANYLEKVKSPNKIIKFTENQRGNFSTFLPYFLKNRGNYWQFFLFLKNRKEDYFAFFIRNNSS